MNQARPGAETLVVPEHLVEPKRPETPPAAALPARKLVFVLHMLGAVVAVAVSALVLFQLHFALPVAGFVLFLVIVVTALRLGFREATFTSVIAVAFLDFLFTQPLYSFKTDSAGVTALTAFECAALVVSHLAAQVQLQARIANQQRNSMERLYDLARNILLVDRSRPTGLQIAGFIQKTIGVDSVALFDPSSAQVYTAGAPQPDLEQAARNTWLIDKEENNVAGNTWSRVLRLGNRGSGSIALRANHLSPILADAIASLAAIALERSRSLEKETRAEAARQGEQLRTAVLDALAHAFKTPLTTILAASSGLLELGSLNPQETELVTLIDEQAVILDTLTTRLLQTARLEGAEMHLRRKETALGDLLGQVLELFAPQLARRAVHILVPDPDVPVSGDSSLITTALSQLVDNALKYSDPGAPITISGEAARNEIVISVHNEGLAIRPEDRERIFDRFYRSPGTQHRAAGTGLGLSIARRIAEAHHGRVWAAGTQNGATFCFALPLAAPARGLRFANEEAK